MAAKIPIGDAVPIATLVTDTPGGIASRVLAKTAAGSVTLFALDRGEEISEHSAPFDALVLTLEGELTLTVGGRPIAAPAGTITVLPARIPHAVQAPARARMLLIMLREPNHD